MRGGERGLEPEVAQDRRIDAMGEIAQLTQRVFEAVPEYVQPSHNLRILLDQLTRERELDAQAGQVLLCAVVQVALDLAALEITGGHRASTRRGKLGGRRLSSAVKRPFSIASSSA